MFIKVQNYYEITTAILCLEHVQKPVDVGGFSAMARKSFVRGIEKSRIIFSGFVAVLSIVFGKFCPVIKFKLLIHKAKRGEQTCGGLVPVLLPIQHLDRRVIRERFLYRVQDVAAILRGDVIISKPMCCFIEGHDFASFCLFDNGVDDLLLELFHFLFLLFLIIITLFRAGVKCFALVTSGAGLNVICVPDFRCKLRTPNQPQ